MSTARLCASPRDSLVRPRQLPGTVTRDTVIRRLRDGDGAGALSPGLDRFCVAVSGHPVQPPPLPLEGLNPWRAGARLTPPPQGPARSALCCCSTSFLQASRRGEVGPKRPEALRSGKEERTPGPCPAAFPGCEPGAGVGGGGGREGWGAVSRPLSSRDAPSLARLSVCFSTWGAVGEVAGRYRMSNTS